MAQVIWTEPALQDLDQIADYISLDNPAAAKKLVHRCFNRVENLNQHPKLGKAVPELGESVYRQLDLSPCRIFYRIDNGTIYIIHVMRAEQLLHLNILKSR
ncbi:type II toxin-antitoxin system RelE/ParE family toxin [Fodinibius halophilus]|uniref:Type II toxin-antitoxin system RelE/ParE family toxin n=1 Tax=Fodinibius halophilus TaxID=1736908 RepID=A0A6M1TA85_9BACT|nr:type II toxin-antitoxin system RelE/ParE family toxin [Fodinibius halophilus]NGP89373.1 type II toxin-antitoxin system RelE/ParE family toxin [Fodinibius halophilus]